MSWNEFNTFSKFIYPYLEKQLGYPRRENHFFDEQTYVRKRGNRKGPYDGAFIDAHKEIFLLVEAKREGKKLDKEDCEQAFDYCLGESFSLPPPYVLVSNGHKHKWFRRFKNINGFSYKECEQISYQQIIEEAASDSFIEEISLRELNLVLSKIRKKIFQDLTEKYFPEEYTFRSSELGIREQNFRKILNTRKTFVDKSLDEEKNEKRAIKAILSSISLSIVLKVLFIKIFYDRKTQKLPVNLSQKIDQLSSDFPGILKVEPYDILTLSDRCEEDIRIQLTSFRVMQALFFENIDNPIGEIWDSLVESEELDLQVKSLGNVYTPKPIVKTMVDSAEQSLGYWNNKKALEPACGSGHFVREIYNRIRDFYLYSHPALKSKPAKIHQKVLAHIRAIDIDPFAIQTTQLGMFLELYRSQDLWKALAPSEKFDFSKVVAQGDFLEDGFFKRFSNFKPDLIIGNPPYGIKVTDTIQQHFKLGSKDSYGCFILQSINTLENKGNLLFIVSNTFLMAKTHESLRKEIFNRTKIKNIFQLHRNTFPGRDVFPCIFHLEKSSVSEQDKDSTYYEFIDSWPVHPEDEIYEKALSYLKKKHNKIERTKLNSYKIPYRLSCLRLKNPIIKRESLKDKFASRNYLDGEKHNYPILGGDASLALFCSDIPVKSIILESKARLLNKEIDCLLIKRKNKSIPVIKLWQIASVMQGLATADNQRFLRKAKDVRPNAIRRDIEDVPKGNIKLSSLNREEKENGIKVLDPSSDRYFVPFDKGGEQDTAGGELNNFWKPVDYWIDWSEEAVRTLKKRNKWPPRTPKKPRFQNAKYYFQTGISCTVTGLYAPTYRLSFGGVFGSKENLILPFDKKLNKYLLIVLCSKLMRYFAKAFIQNTVDFITNSFHYLPLVVPTRQELQKAEKIYDSVIQLKKEHYGQRGLTAKIDKLVDPFVNRLYRLDEEDILEIQTWFKRRYPHFGREKG